MACGPGRGRGHRGCRFGKAGDPVGRGDRRAAVDVDLALPPSRTIRLQVVGRDHDGDADFLEALEQLHHLEREPVVEVAGRLVGDQHRRPRTTGAGEADALLLADRELRVDALAAEQAHLVERGTHAPVDLAQGVSVTTSGNATLSNTGRSISSLWSWNTTPTLRRKDGMARGHVEVLAPSTTIVPRVGRSSSAISFSTVLLPAPERPVRNTISPRPMRATRWSAPRGRSDSAC